MCKCKYLDCKNEATKAWALVDLCENHHEKIRLETNKYYKGTLSKEERSYYRQIQHLTPWR